MKTVQSWEQLFYVRDKALQCAPLRPILLKALHELNYFKATRPKIILLAGAHLSEITAHLLQQLGIVHQQRTGLFSANILMNLNERIRLQGEVLSSDKLLSFLESHKSLSEKLKLTSSETLLLAALDYFQREHVSLVIIESGLGWADAGLHHLKSDLLVLMDEQRHYDEGIEHQKKSVGFDSETVSCSREGPVVVAMTTPSPALRKNLTELGAHVFWLGEHWQFIEDSPGNCILTGIKRRRYLFPIGQYDAHGLATAVVSWEALFGPLELDLLLKAVLSLDIAGSFHQIFSEPYMILDTSSSLKKMRLLARRLLYLEEKRYLRGWNILCDLPLALQTSKELENFTRHPRFDLQFLTPPTSESGLSRTLLEEGIVTHLCMLRRQERRRIAKFLHQMRLDAFLNKKGVFVFGSYAVVAHVFAVLGINNPLYCPAYCGSCPAIGL